jgi:hypothetical protein
MEYNDRTAKMHSLTEKPILRKLSLEPEECSSLLSSLPTTIVKELWKSAEIIISYHKVDELQNGHFMSRLTVYLERNVCQCLKFKKLGLFGHIFVLTDEKGRFKELFNNFKYNPSIAIYNKAPSASEKRVKKPRKGKQNVKKLPTELETDDKNEFNDLNVHRPFRYCEP